MKPEPTAPADRSFDAFALVAGILVSGFAGGALYWAFGGTFHPAVLRMALPVFLVALGMTGLLLSRRT